jgi:hypothetical protein
MPDGPERPQPRDDASNAGASARREYERRRTKRQQDTRAKHPRLGGLILALQGTPQSENAWASGADGEQHVATRLLQLLKPGTIVLHDRHVPRTRANIDHIAIAPSGVWVIDTKRYSGKVEIRNRLFRRAELRIAGRNKTELAHALARQRDLVVGIVAELQLDVDVRGALCFVDADLPTFGTPRINGFPLYHVRALARQLNKPGPLGPDQITQLAAHLVARLPPA